jgi:hypothetical protein
MASVACSISSKSANATGIPPLARIFKMWKPGYLDRSCLSSSSVQLGPRLAINKVEQARAPEPPSDAFSKCPCRNLSVSYWTIRKSIWKYLTVSNK